MWPFLEGRLVVCTKSWRPLGLSEAVSAAMALNSRISLGELFVQLSSGTSAVWGSPDHDYRKITAG